MNRPKWLIPVILLSALLLNACSFTVKVLPTPNSSAPTATQPSTIVQTPTPPTPMLPSATPTLIPIRADTISMLAVFKTFELTDIVRSLAFKPDGSVLAAAGGNSDDFNIHLWDVVNDQPLGELDGHTGIIWSLAFSPDGLMLASVSSDKTAKVWDWHNGTLLKSLDFPGQVVSVSFSPDGQSLAVGGVDEAQNQIQNASVWTFAVGSWKPVLKLPEFLDVAALAYSPDGSLLVGGGTSRNVQVWKTSDGSSLFTLNHSHQVSKAAVSPDSSTVVTATCETTVNDQCTEGSVWLWDLSTGKLIRKLTGFPDAVENLAFTPDGSSLVAASRDGTLRFFDATDDHMLFEFASPEGISALALSPDSGLLATGSVNGQVNLWKVVYSS